MSQQRRHEKGQAEHPCAKLSRADTYREGRNWFRWAVPAVGLVSLIWFLVRVIPKPGRASYPCQRLAAPLASAFVVWLLGIAGALAAFRKAGRHLGGARYGAAIFCLVAGVAAIWLALNVTDEQVALAGDPTPNDPKGAASGLYPGRVVWVHNPDATDWVGPGDGYWWDNDSIDQTVVDNMISQTIRELTASPNDEEAWDALFRYFNENKGRGDVGYNVGEKIMVKVNMVGSFFSGSRVNEDGQQWQYLDAINTAPQTILALLRQLIHKAQVAQADVTVGDTLAHFPNHYWDLCHGEFPDVHYLCYHGHLGRTGIARSTTTFIQFSTSSISEGIPTCFVDAAYVINFAVLKGHRTAGVTLCGKNHYGSLFRQPIDPAYFNLHASRVVEQPGMGHYRALVDLMGCEDIGGKTVLYLVDGLYAAPTEYRYDTPVRWNTAPFNGDWPSSLFASQDPVAIDSVGYDFLWAEWDDYPRMDGADDYLHEAAEADNPASGTFYDPENDGVRMGSLGTHEHWNNAVDKQYSRNLGTGGGIELVSYLTNNYTPQVDAGEDQSSAWPDTQLALHGTTTDDGHPNPPGSVEAIWRKVSGPCDVTFSDNTSPDTTATFDCPGLYVLELEANDGDASTSDTLTIDVMICGDANHPFPAGDLNQDCRVNWSDFGAFASGWLDEGCTDPTWCGGADLNGSGQVNWADFAIFAAHWLECTAPVCD